LSFLARPRLLPESHIKRHRQLFLLHQAYHVQAIFHARPAPERPKPASFLESRLNRPISFDVRDPWRANPGIVMIYHNMPPIPAMWRQWFSLRSSLESF
jgi:hypothetical protein